MLQVRRPFWLVLLLGTAFVAGGTVGAFSAPGDDPAVTDAAADTPADDPRSAEQIALDNEQAIIVQRFRQFEKNLLVMARYLRKAQPEQAELIERAIKQSKGNGVARQMEAIVDLLESSQFGDALERQDEVVGELKSLLLLLQSGDRRDEIEKEKARIKDLIKDLNRVIRNQNDTRADTERGGDPDQLAQRQQNVADQTQDLVDKIDGQDAARSGNPGEGKPGEGKPGEGKPGEGKPGEGKPGEGKPGEGKPGEGKPGEGKPGEGKPGEGKPGEGKPGEGKPGEGKPGEGKPGEGKPGEGKPGEGMPGEGMPGEGMPGEGKPGEGKPGEGKPGEGKPGEGMPGEGMPGEGMPGEGKPGEGKPGMGQPGMGQPGEGEPGDSGGEPGEPGDPGEQDPNAKKTPGRDDIAQAKKDMERAIEELKKRERDAASKHQDDALAKLKEAKEKLEEILRQLREEERKLLLAALEARFDKMLEMQRAVYRGTLSLAAVEPKDFGRLEERRSAKLSGDEREIVTEADKALALLREEGSSVAFPEAVEQLREDLIIIAERLSPQYPETDPRADVGEITQAIEKDVIEALEELIEALKKEMEKSRKKSPPPPPGPMGEPPDPGLVDKLAELKMLRSLQLRINRRTKLLGRNVDGEQAVEVETVEQLQQLSRRQASIQKAAYDLATGRNQ